MGLVGSAKSFRLSSIRYRFSNLNMHQHHLEDLLKHRLLGPTPKVSGSLGLE